MSYPRLLGDVGGTNARFAWQVSPQSAPSDVAVYHCAEFASLHDALRHYLAERAEGPAARWAAIGIANPVIGDQVRMTNHHWSFSIEALRHALGLERLLVINDFTALALALPVLPPAELRPLRMGTAAPDAPLALIGPGTGLGVSGLLPARDGRKAVPIAGEGGHVTLAATDEREEAVIGLLRRRYGHVSAERALSGPGLVNLHQAVCALAGADAPALTAAEITAHAQDGSDSHCAQTLDLFFGWLGNVAGNLALSLGARGGVYLGGGIVPRLGGLIDRSRFAAQFVAKGRFREYLEPIPVFVVNAGHNPALIGAARALEDL